MMHPQVQDPIPSCKIRTRGGVLKVLEKLRKYVAEMLLRRPVL
jgi:hypothetical protein